MKKHLIALTCLALPMIAMAGDGKPANPGAAKRPAMAASAPAPAASAIDSRKAVQAARQGTATKSSCLRQALNDNLTGDAHRQFVLTCMAGG